MNTNLQQQLERALNASENMLLALGGGDFDAAIELDGIRMEFIRELAKHRNKAELLTDSDRDIQHLCLLDKKILEASEKLRDEVLTDIQDMHSTNAVHAAYVQNQGL